MYKLSIPVMSSTINEKNLETYAKLCHKAGAERIFLAIPSIMSIPQDLTENVSYFQSQGFEVGIWTDTIGHGFVLSHVEQEEASAFQPIVDITGSVRHHANCPLDPVFQNYIAKRISSLAKTGANIVMLDDDFRMSQHGGELCCACEMHLMQISEQLGEEITIEKIRPYILSGKSNPYRDAWVSSQKYGLTELARAIRKEVDKVAPQVTVCCCTALSPWNVDGVDMIEISRILAGENHPILRLTGAPYWATKKRRQFPLIATFEIARMLASFAEQKGVELMSEGDVYPRPRYTCPASYLELYDAVTRIDGGYDGILKYMLDYLAGPNFEPGYLEHHNENRPYVEKLSEMFEGGANAGVRIVSRPHTYQNADLDLGQVTDVSPRPLDATMLGSCSIPTVYRGRGVCNSVFGENARTMELDRLGEGTILDAVSAVILSERGIDVGLSSYGTPTEQTITSVCTNDEEYKSFVSDGEARVLPAILSEDAEPLLFISNPKRKNTLAYRYENANGERFLVFLFEGDSIYAPTRVCLSGLIKNYAVQRVLLEMIPWVARKRLPAYSQGNPELYLMCQTAEKSMSVALFNCFADAITDLKIHLDRPYGRIECLNCEAFLEGETVTLTTRLYGYCSAAFRVYND